MCEIGPRAELAAKLAKARRQHSPQVIGRRPPPAEGERGVRGFLRMLSTRNTEFFFEHTVNGIHAILKYSKNSKNFFEVT